MPACLEPVVRLQRFEHRDAGADDGRHVVSALAQHLQAADRKRLVVAVDDRGLRPARADVNRAGMIGGQRDEPLGADRVARVEHRDVRLRPAHREILERHLRRTVLADRHARVRAGHLDPDLADRRHADEVGRARQEAGEGGRKRNRAARSQPHGGADHHLLGNEVLVEAIGQHLLELVAEGRVLHVGVERDDAGVGVAQLRDRGAVRFACRDLVADLVGRRRHRFGLRVFGSDVAGGFGICAARSTT